ncbi:hypothetical protein QIS74_03559 [Colletotrichum tabaci]|uniref:DUF6536 domain-containing protein n=1 Tax=Colletotrichum tabaci TaxID=1209068 RepID=A0AAV9TKL0_9PEZI
MAWHGMSLAVGTAALRRPTRKRISLPPKSCPPDGAGWLAMLHTAIHVVINNLSTVLLAGSNYCMQCAIAPTRSEIDRAHARRKWLDIGVPSIRNFGKIKLEKKALWLLLSLSSFPLHLL